MNRREFIKGAIITSAVLSSGSSMADENKKKINRLTAGKNPSGLEQAHVPAIEIPGTVKTGEWFDVHVKVGFMQEHPSTPGHWIEEIKLLIDGKEAAETKFDKGGITASFASFRIKIDKDSAIEAIEECNLHGKWISEPVSVRVT